MSSDAQTALAQVREALVNEALFDPGASTADTYSACKAFGTACTPENVRAILAHVEAQAAEIERLTKSEQIEAQIEARDALLDFISENGTASEGVQHYLDRYVRAALAARETK